MIESNYDIHLQELYTRSVERLICAETFDLIAFEDLRDYLRGKATRIKNEHVVSKQVLFYLMRARGSIREKAEWILEAGEHLSMADEFEDLLSYIAWGVDPTEQQPGVARII